MFLRIYKRMIFQFFLTLVVLVPLMENKIKKVFVEGAITPDFIANAIAKHQSKTMIGAHDIFLGQVRADEIKGKKVGAIEYTAYESMANQKFHEIREGAFKKFDLSCMHIYHSLGKVAVGEICLFVFVSSDCFYYFTSA